MRRARRSARRSKIRYSSPCVRTDQGRRRLAAREQPAAPGRSGASSAASATSPSCVAMFLRWRRRRDVRLPAANVEIQSVCDQSLFCRRYSEAYSPTTVEPQRPHPAREIGSTKPKLFMEPAGIEPATSCLQSRGAHAGTNEYGRVASATVASSLAKLASAVLKAVLIDEWYSCGTLRDRWQLTVAKVAANRPAHS